MVQTSYELMPMPAAMLRWPLLLFSSALTSVSLDFKVQRLRLENLSDEPLIVSMSEFLTLEETIELQMFVRKVLVTDDKVKKHGVFQSLMPGAEGSEAEFERPEKLNVKLRHSICEVINRERRKSTKCILPQAATEIDVIKRIERKILSAVSDIYPKTLLDPLGGSVHDSSAAASSMPLHLGPPAIYSYGEGGYFLRHHDFTYKGDLKKANYTSTHARLVSFFVYLNTLSDGSGTTDFLELGLKVAPEAGKAVSWYNGQSSDPHTMEPQLYHLGNEVGRGQKKIMMGWHVHKGVVRRARDPRMPIAESHPEVGAHFFREDVVDNGWAKLLQAEVQAASARELSRREL
eukprot:TRINITY_DN75267_c0_g1_i1.p1 TRINITY_DN75267_c0_g1~~TRINITY_DN75267_c0_g1_i1.p1  ORF type:complete len:347 (-),score=47.39 TRINITY_DN75267_c0_g1_i1:30-1070(-)